MARRAATPPPLTTHRLTCRRCGSTQVRVVCSSRETLESVDASVVRYFRRRWCRCGACGLAFSGLWTVTEAEIERNDIQQDK